jgi:hypothetical protein
MSLFGAPKVRNVFERCGTMFADHLDRITISLLRPGLVSAKRQQLPILQPLLHSEASELSLLRLRRLLLLDRCSEELNLNNSSSNLPGDCLAVKPERRVNNWDHREVCSGWDRAPRTTTNSSNNNRMGRRLAACSVVGVRSAGSGPTRLLRRSGLPLGSNRVVNNNWDSRSYSNLSSLSNNSSSNNHSSRNSNSCHPGQAVRGSS